MVKTIRNKILANYMRCFGRTAVNRGYVTPKQLKEAIAEQVDDNIANRPHRFLGMIFFEKKMMSANQIEQVLDEVVRNKMKMKRFVSKKVGNLFSDDGALSEEQ